MVRNSPNAVGPRHVPRYNMMGKVFSSRYLLLVEHNEIIFSFNGLVAGIVPPLQYIILILGGAYDFLHLIVSGSVLGCFYFSNEIGIFLNLGHYVPKIVYLVDCKKSSVP